MNSEKNKKKWVKQVEDTLKLNGRSKTTIANYVSSINRFLYFYDETTKISKLKEEDLLDYIKKEFLEKNKCGASYNVNICAIRFLYLVCFERELNRRLLPNMKLTKKIPTIIEKTTFLNLINKEENIEHKCWLLLSFCCGLRVEEVATIRIENIYPKEHKLKVLGKGNKERFTILPDITIKLLRFYCKTEGIREKEGYLFKGNANHEHINPKTIINYFTELKRINKLNNNISFHSLRHSFATYYLMNGGNILTLKSMMGHKSLNSTSIYIHIAQNFNELEGIKYV